MLHPEDLNLRQIMKIKPRNYYSMKLKCH